MLATSRPVRSGVLFCQHDLAGAHIGLRHPRQPRAPPGRSSSCGGIGACLDHYGLGPEQAPTNRPVVAPCLPRCPAFAPQPVEAGADIAADVVVDTNGHAEEAQAAPEAAKLYFVRMPRPPMDDTKLKKLQAEFQAHIADIKAINTRLAAKRVRCAAAFFRASRSTGGREAGGIFGEGQGWAVPSVEATSQWHLPSDRQMAVASARTFS
eukprot:200676-Chlamydomonas_euryale.AAC.14